MNLPFVLNVAIGLIFIFLILSLLASEIQELITTLLQWRAKHLRDAIEILLAGDVETREEARTQELVSKLYDDPLIKNINQGAKGFLAEMFRAITRWLIPGNQKGSFGTRNATGPSYIAPETFATSLLERVGLANLAKKLIEVRLQKFATRIIGIYDVQTVQREDGTQERIVLPPPDGDKRLKALWNKGRIRLIAERANWQNLDQDKNFQVLVEEFDDILNDFKSGENNLVTSVERMGESFSTYIENYPLPEQKSQDSDEKKSANVPEWQSESTNDTEPLTDNFVTSTEEIEATQPEHLTQPISRDKDLVYFAKRLRSFKLGMFGTKSERAVASGGLRPSLLEIAELLDQSSSTYHEVIDAYRNLREEGKVLDEEVIPALEEELLVTHHIEALEQELIANHLEQVEYQLEKLLAAKNPRWCDELQNKLKNNSDKAKAAKVDASKPIRRRRGLLRKMRTSFMRQWRRRTIPTPEVIQQQRQQIITEMIDRFSEKEQLELTVAVLRSMDHKQLLGEVEKGHFGVIDCALDRLANEEQRFLIDKVLTRILGEKKEKALREGREWNEEFEEQQRSLYNNYQTYKTTQLTLSKLPNSVKESFAILARRAQTRIQHTGGNINQFREEVAVWFDRSMSRASGVYKRNAKGVAILIGLLLVTATNVDAGFIVDRLSNDENLRDVVATRAISSGEARTLDEARAKTNEALKELALPIGWNPANVADQLNCEVIRNSNNSRLNNSNATSSKNWDLPSDWSDFYTTCLTDPGSNSQASSQINQASNNPFQTFIASVGHLLRNLFLSVVRYPLATIRMLFGWLIAGIAISMGAPFWFDLLGKIVNVRNSGGKPPSNENQSVAKPVSAETSVKQP